jgi:hypothetical protein
MGTGHRQNELGFFRGKITRNILLFISVLAAMTPPGPLAATIVAYMGNSITAGDRLPHQSARRYPSVLARMLADSFAVEAIAAGGLCAQRSADKPLWNFPPFENYFHSSPTSRCWRSGPTIQNPAIGKTRKHSSPITLRSSGYPFVWI